MAMTVKRRKEVKTPSVIMHKIADIRGGVSISTEGLGGRCIREGAFITAPINGVCHVVKTAITREEATPNSTEIEVEKFHNFVVGDAISNGNIPDTAQPTIKEIREGVDSDTLVLDNPFGGRIPPRGLVELGHEVYNPALEPVAIVGTTKVIEPNTNVITDAWVVAVTNDNPLPTNLSGGLKGIINI